MQVASVLVRPKSEQGEHGCDDHRNTYIAGSSATPNNKPSVTITISKVGRLHTLVEAGGCLSGLPRSGGLQEKWELPSAFDPPSSISYISLPSSSLPSVALRFLLLRWRRRFLLCSLLPVSITRSAGPPVRPLCAVPSSSFSSCSSSSKNLRSRSIGACRSRPSASKSESPRTVSWR